MIIISDNQDRCLKQNIYLFRIIMPEMYDSGERDFTLRPTG